MCACNSYLFDVRGLEEEDASLCEQSLVGAMLIDTMYSVVLGELHSDCCMTRDGMLSLCFNKSNPMFLD